MPIGFPHPNVGFVRGWAERSYNAGEDLNVRNIIRLLKPNSGRTMIDLGCDDGELTLKMARRLRVSEVYGVEIVPERARMAEERGVRALVANLAARFPLRENGFDIVCSKEVIEHVTDTDMFVAEIFRILKPGGYAVISTDNLASWHNVAAIAMGWQPFSLTNVSQYYRGLGNPLALQRGKEPQLKSWEHMRVFAYRGLRELFTAHGFTVEAVAGAGYFPLPAMFGRLDPRHSMFLTVKVRKPRT